MLDEVCDGLRALEKPHRKMISAEAKGEFADSLDLDKARRRGHEQENRWDYLLGHARSDSIVALEPHSAWTQLVVGSTPLWAIVASGVLSGPHFEGGVIVSW